MRQKCLVTLKVRVADAEKTKLKQREERTSSKE